MNKAAPARAVMAAGAGTGTGPPRECLLTGCVLYSLLAITPNGSSVTDTQEWTHRQHPGTASKDGSQHQAEKRNTHRLTHKKRKDCPLFKILHLLFICELSRRSFFCFVLVKPVFFFFSVHSFGKDWWLMKQTGYTNSCFFGSHVGAIGSSL